MIKSGNRPLSLCFFTAIGLTFDIMGCWMELTTSCLFESPHFSEHSDTKISCLQKMELVFVSLTPQYDVMNYNVNPDSWVSKDKTPQAKTP